MYDKMKKSIRSKPITLPDKNSKSAVLVNIYILLYRMLRKYSGQWDLTVEFFDVDWLIQIYFQALAKKNSKLRKIEIFL